jgi:pyruvate dehydrogenase E2 component (dihydrolipoamide acetyltransferase)
MKENGMASEIKLPELGEKVEGGEVVDVKVAVGDEVREGQGLIEVEAEKSTVEVPSPVAGRVTQLLVKKGDKVQTGQTLCFVEARDGQAEGAKTAPVRETAEAKPEPKPEPKPTPPSPPAAAPTPPPVVPRLVAGPAPAPQHSEAPAKLVPAGPATRRLARELGVELTLVRGTAPGGRVTQDDVKNYVKQLASGDGAPRGLVRQAPPLPDFERWGPVERKPLEGVRRRTAE